MTDTWQPESSPATLRERAALMRAVREWFNETPALEVDTPVLTRYGVTDPSVASIPAELPLAAAPLRYLRSSPEYEMKRLLAAGSGDIWQLGPVFRGGEAGTRHQPEFTMLEWYRVGCDYEGIISETTRLLARLLTRTNGADPGVLTIEYSAAVAELAGVDIDEADIPAISAACPAADEALARSLGNDRQGWLDLLVSTRVIPALDPKQLTVLTHFPIDQAMLARAAADAPDRAERFEVFFGGMELANGYVELTDAEEQARRFETDRLRRKALNLPDMQADPYLLAALEHGLPECAGVAVGIDRVLQTRLAAASIRDVRPFRVD